MSIKAKLEAIIYAAEEPITLDQMAALLKEDLLALKTAVPASAGNAGSDRLQTARDGPGNQRYSRRGCNRRDWHAAGPQAHHDCRQKSRGGPAHAVQDHQGFSDALWTARPDRTAQPGRI